jgi:hypothetical protein
MDSELLSVRPSVPYFYATYDLQNLDSKRRLSIYEEYGWVFRSKAQELWDWAQIRLKIGQKLRYVLYGRPLIHIYSFYTRFGNLSWTWLNGLNQLRDGLETWKDIIITHVLCDRVFSVIEIWVKQICCSSRANASRFTCL